jgi:O-antigen/teichoic acid export membrane protein
VFSRIVAYFTLLLSAAALAMSLVIRDVIAIVAAPQFHDAYKVVPAVALAYVFYGISYYFQTGVFISKKTTYLGLMGAICASTNIALNFWLIPRYAAMGAAWATTLSFMLMAALAYSFSQRVYRIPYSLFRVVLPVIVAAAVYVLSTIVRASSPIASLALKPLLMVAFVSVVFALGFFNESEVLRIRHTLQLARGRLVWGVFGSTSR